MYIIDSKGNEINISNEIYKSKFIEDANQDEKIFIMKNIKKYYFEQDLTFLSNSKLVKYIIFCLMFVW